MRGKDLGKSPVSGGIFLVKLPSAGVYDRDPLPEGKKQRVFVFLYGVAKGIRPALWFLTKAGRKEKF